MCGVLHRESRFCYSRILAIALNSSVIGTLKTQNFDLKKLGICAQCTQNGLCAPPRVSFLLLSYPSNSAKLKRDRNFESAELGSENGCAVRQDGIICGCINLCRSLYKAVAIIIRYKWQLRGLDGLL
jgi:hypothetical protein